MCVLGGGGEGANHSFFVAKRNIRYMYLPGTPIQRSQAHVW